MATNSKTTVKKTKETKYIFAVGRRKSATAKVRLYSDKKGDIDVNGMPIGKYFSGETAENLFLAPLRACNVIGKYHFSIKVMGSGIMGQLGAVIHGMSRALALAEPDKFQSLLRRRGFLTRDPRAKERRKVGTGGKARRQKQSPKR